MGFIHLFIEVLLMIVGAFVAAIVAIAPPCWVGDKTENTFAVIITFLISTSLVITTLMYISHLLKL